MRKILFFVFICNLLTQQAVVGQRTLPSGRFATAAFDTNPYRKHHQTLTNVSAITNPMLPGKGRK
ncbi:hypothetical protein ACR79M_18325 [Sphingobacterium spiritivorum]|uniref:hypothetical protein n=1 Tax=Sphingobacterium TaxID=28453 RepID=UPI0025EF718B|nr:MULTISPECIES: hypothetical protein [unclassified Sphingobacterium]